MGQREIESHEQKLSPRVSITEINPWKLVEGDLRGEFSSVEEANRAAVAVFLGIRDRDPSAIADSRDEALLFIRTNQGRGLWLSGTNNPKALPLALDFLRSIGIDLAPGQTKPQKTTLPSAVSSPTKVTPSLDDRQKSLIKKGEWKFAKRGQHDTDIVGIFSNSREAIDAAQAIFDSLPNRLRGTFRTPRDMFPLVNGQNGMIRFSPSSDKNLLTHVSAIIQSCGIKIENDDTSKLSVTDSGKPVDRYRGNTRRDGGDPFSHNRPRRPGGRS